MSGAAAGEMHPLTAALLRAVEQLQQRDLDGAEASIAQVLKAAPKHPSAVHLDGVIALQRGRPEDAIRRIKQALAINPRSAAADSDIGLAYTAIRKFEEARAHLEQAVALKPDFTEAWLNLGNVHRELGDGRAAACYREALKLRPAFRDAHNNLAAELLDLGRPREAEAEAREALRLDPGFGPGWQTLGRVLDTLGQETEAIAALRRATDLMPGNARAYGDLGNTQMAFGHRDDAVASYRTAMMIEPDRLEWRRVLAKLDAEAGSPEEAEALLKRKGVGDADRMHLSFALAKSYEDRGDFTRAFAHMTEANKLKRKSFRYDRRDSEAAFADIMASFTPELFAAHASAGVADDTPIFVLGMPRSGTTLVEQILASHPNVAGAGELPLLRNVVAKAAGEGPLDYAALLDRLDDAALTAMGADYVAQLRAYAPGARHITDKLPGNFLLIGFIRLCLPRAKVVHCVRDPADTAISIYKNFFSSQLGYAYQLGELGHYYRLYEQLMAHWHAVLPGFVHNIAYEALVADQEGETRRLLEFCGLDFRPEVLEFHRTARPVHTASAAQVRNPIGKGSVGISRKYGAALDPFRAALAGK